MSRAFIAFYMGDYDRDTQHLSTLEHGAYFLLLKHCWVHGSIPLSQKDRGLVAQVSRQQWYRMCTKINAFFDDQGRQKRASIEIEKAEKLSTRQAMAGHRGAKKRWGKDSHGHTMANGHGHAPGDGHGMAIKKEDITTTVSVAAREGSAMGPVSKPVISVTPELAATIQKKKMGEPMLTAIPLRVLIACEFSGVVRQAFRSRGHDAWSCDLLPAEDASEYHCECDVETVLGDGWDLMIAHPPCTHLAVSGARWFDEKRDEQRDALTFVRCLMLAPVPHIAIENPVSIISSRIRKPDQVLQPWMFGHGETKATCLWLKGLPLLKPTNVVDGRHARVHLMPPGPDRWRERSRTMTGIAEAMAEQWGSGASVPVQLDMFAEAVA